MPAQLSTVLYISDYKEKTSSDFFIGTALGYTRLEEDGEAVQTFNITVFYPVDEEKPCYLPKLKEGQVLSIANSKFCKGNSNNDLDVSIQFILQIKSSCYCFFYLLIIFTIFFFRLY